MKNLDFIFIGVQYKCNWFVCPWPHVIIYTHPVTGSFALNTHTHTHTHTQTLTYTCTHTHARTRTHTAYIGPLCAMLRLLLLWLTASLKYNLSAKKLFSQTHTHTHTHTHTLCITIHKGIIILLYVHTLAIIVWQKSWQVCTYKT